MFQYMKTIIIFLFFPLISSNIITIPFKILNKNSLNNFDTSDPFLFLRNEIENSLYTEIYIGEPPEKITAIITFNSIDLELHPKISKNFFSDTSYRRNKSSTYKEIFFEGKDESSIKRYFKEQIKLYNDINFRNLITINDLNFSFFDFNKKEEESSFCFNIGFKLLENIENQNDINTNFIIQLKQKKLMAKFIMVL